MDEILALFGRPDLKYEDLSPDEKKVYEQALNTLSSSEISPQKYREFKEQLLFSVCKELAEHQVNPKDEATVIRDAHLKARLRNYLLDREFLAGPERARKAIEKLKEQKA